MRNFINIINESIEEGAETFKIFTSEEEREKVRQLLASKSMSYEEEEGTGKIGKYQFIVAGDNAAKDAMVRAVKMAHLSQTNVGQMIEEGLGFAPHQYGIVCKDGADMWLASVAGKVREFDSLEEAEAACEGLHSAIGPIVISWQ